VEIGEDTQALRSCFLQSSSTVRFLAQISKVPYVMFTAPNSPHITYDHCFVSYLHQAGVKDGTWIQFRDLAIQGNGYIFYLEMNNLDLAAVVEKEIARRDEHSGQLLRRDADKRQSCALTLKHQQRMASDMRPLSICTRQTLRSLNAQRIGDASYLVQKISQRWQNMRATRPWRDRPEHEHVVVYNLLNTT
jgi:hypothetical protein